jgi:hypothetical protein
MDARPPTVQYGEALLTVPSWAIDTARELERVASSANHFGISEFRGNGIIIRVERSASGTGTSFWRVATPF